MRNFNAAALPAMKEILRKRHVRITLYLLGLLVALFFLLQWLIRNHTKDLIEELITQETRGKVRLDIGKLKFSFYPITHIDIHDTRLEVMDSAGQLPSYSIKIKYLGLQLQSLRSFLFQRQLLVDYFIAQNPEISIYPHVKKQKREGNALVHVELGNIYLAMQRIAQTMRVKKFGIFDCKLHISSPRPDDMPVDLTDIDFQVDEFVMASAENGQPSDALHVSKLKLRTGRQYITFPNGDYRMKYAGLEINSADNSVRIDSFYISGMNTDTAYGSLEAGFRNLRLVNIDFETLYKQDLLKVDSVYCQDPDLRLNLDLTARKINQKKKEPVRRVGTRGLMMDPSKNTRSIEDTRVEKRIADLIGKLDIGYIGLINSDISVNTKNGNRYTPFSTRGNNFEAAGIRINSDNENPIEIDNLVFAIKNYKASTSDSLYDFFFDSVAYHTGTLALKNFRLQPSPKNQQPNKKFFSIPDFELRDLSLVELVSNKRFKARELVLKNSRTINYFIPKTKTIRAPQPITAIIAEVSKTVDLDRVRLENAYILNESVTNRKQRIIITGIYSDISANEMLRAPTYEIMGYSVGYVRFDSMNMVNGPIQLYMINGEILGKEQQIRAEHLSFSDNRNRTRVQVNNALIRNYHFDDDFEQISVDSIHWKEAMVTFEQGNTPVKKEKSPENSGIYWIARHIYAENTTLNYVSGDSMKAEINLKSLDIRDLASDETGRISLRYFALAGNRIGYAAPGLMAGTGPFLIRESSASSIRDIRIEYQKATDTIKASVPELRFVPLIAETLQKKYPVFRELNVYNPVVFASLHAHAGGSAKKENAALPVDIGKLAINQAELDIRQQGEGKSIHARTNQLDLLLGRIQKDIGKSAFSLGSTSLKTPVFELVVNDSMHLMMDEGTLALDLDRLTIGRKEDSGSFHALLRRLEARDLSMQMMSRKGKEPLELNSFDIGGENLQIDSLQAAHVIRQLKANPSLFVRNINLRKTTPTSELSAYGIGYRNGGRMVTVDSVRYRPLIDRDSFSRTLQWQKVYLDEASTGKITIHDFDIERIVTDSSYHIRAIDIQQPYAAIYKDKRVAFNFSTIKPLPTTMLKNVQQRIQVDSMRLYDARITYEEFNDKTKMLGSVHFKDMRALVRGVRTYDFGPRDSLFLLTYATMEDSIRLRLHVDQSYTDSLNAFYMSVRVAPFNLPVLNAMLEPLASARVVSGHLDTLQMRAIGREYIAHGKMKLYYSDLKVNILDKSNQQHKTVGTRLANFVANLLIDKKNAKKTGSVFAERVREKGFLNYWIKIVLSGALTNTGIRKNTKAEKKYKKALRKEKVPEIPDVDL